TNTRYILGPAGFLEVLNARFDPTLRRFRFAQRFRIGPKPGIATPSSVVDLTADPDPNGDYALMEFTGAQPRARLYSNWEVNTNDQAALKQITAASFNGTNMVIVEAPIRASSATTNSEAGTVEYVSYAPKR